MVLLLDIWHRQIVKYYIYYYIIIFTLVCISKPWDCFFQKTIDYLKMDIEFSEWPALYDIIKSGVIRHIRQLALEVHTPEMDKPWRPDNACTWCRWDTLSFMLRVLIDLHNAGMSLYYSRTNYRVEFISALTRRHRYCCYNLHFVNTKFDADVV